MLKKIPLVLLILKRHYAVELIIKVPDRHLYY
jgi:hypothetical protein